MTVKLPTKRNENAGGKKGKEIGIQNTDENGQTVLEQISKKLPPAYNMVSFP